MISCILESGDKTSLRHVTVKSIIVNDDAEILLVKRAKHLLGGEKYDLPGGFLDRYENCVEGAIREAFEETNLRVKIEFLFRINDNPKRPKEDRQNVEFIYIAKVVSGEIFLDHESTEAKWVSENNLPRDDEFAFDHRESILKYFEYIKNQFKVPIIGKL